MPKNIPKQKKRKVEIMTAVWLEKSFAMKAPNRKPKNIPGVPPIIFRLIDSLKSSAPFSNHAIMLTIGQFINNDMTKKSKAIPGSTN